MEVEARWKLKILPTTRTVYTPQRHWNNKKIGKVCRQYNYTIYIKWKPDGRGSSMEVEARWKWKLDGSGSSMEVEARWKWKPVGDHIFTSRWLMLRLCFSRVCRLQCTMHVPSIYMVAQSGLPLPLPLRFHFHQTSSFTPLNCCC